MARAIMARIRLPTFSIKHPEAFQVRASLPIPQPSTLVGVLAYCLGTAGGMGMDAGRAVGQWVEEGRLMAARASPLGGVPPMAISTTVLRRFRTADKAHFYEEATSGLKYIQALGEAVEKGQLERVKSVLERDLTDAFYREYVMGHEIMCVWVLSDDVDFNPEWVRLVQRLGDTESLCTVLEVKVMGAEVFKETVVETRFPTCLEGAKESIKGAYTIVKMCDEAFFYSRRGQPRRFIVPCEVRVEKVRGGAVPVISPSKVQVEYERPVKVVRTGLGDEIVAYAPARRQRRRRGR